MGKYQGSVTHCPQGHPYNEENTYIYGGRRFCRVCRRAEDYANMLAEQGGVCAICKEPESSERAMPVDHDHTTGKVRALLCTGCNVRISALEDTEWRVKAESYLALWTSPIT